MDEIKKLIQFFPVNAFLLAKIILRDMHISFYNLVYSFPELYRTIRIDFKAYGNNHLGAIVLNVTSNLTKSFLLNYPEFPDS